MKAEQASVFSNVIPRKRSKEGHPVPRHHVYMLPVVTHDADALRAVAETSKESPEDALRHMPWLMAMNAIAAAENVKTLRDDIVAAKNNRNERARSDLSRLRPELENAKSEERSLSKSLATALAPLGLDVREVHPRTYIDEGLSTLDELAGEHGLPSPEEKLRGMYGRLHRLTAILGGGALFGMSLGLLTGTLELYSLSEEWPHLLLFIALGSAVMLLVGAALFPLGRAVGDGLYRLGVSSSSFRHMLPITHLLLLLGLSIAFVVIESRVEMLGLFKALTEDASLISTALSQRDLLWVSLILSLPVVASYVVLGMIEGERKANLCKLLSLKADERKRVLDHDLFGQACGLHEELKVARERKTILETNILHLESSIETGLTTVELHRLEDTEMDAIAASYAAEKSLLKSSFDARTRRARSNWFKTLIRNLIKGR